MSATDPETWTYAERRAAGYYEQIATERAAERAALEVAAAAAPDPRDHIPLGSDVELYDQIAEWAQEAGGGAGGATSLTDLTDVTGEPGPGKAPVADHTGETFPLTEVATQAYVDEQISEALARWAALDQRLSFVDSVAAPWEVSNPSVVLTPDGLTFGPYEDGAATGGSIRYHGLDGQPFTAVRNLAYNMRFTADAPAPGPGAEPYARIYTQDSAGTAHDAIFTPGSQDYPGLDTGPLQEWVATAGMWRYDADDGSGGVPLAELQAANGDHVITSVVITLGWTAGANLAGLLRWLQLNGNRYTFGSA